MFDELVLTFLMLRFDAFAEEVLLAGIVFQVEKVKSDFCAMWETFIS